MKLIKHIKPIFILVHSHLYYNVLLSGLVFIFKTPTKPPLHQRKCIFKQCHVSFYNIFLIYFTSVPKKKHAHDNRLFYMEYIPKPHV